MAKKFKKNSARVKNRALNAFDIAIDDETYIPGTRQQQDIDLEDYSDKKIKQYLSGNVNPEDDEELDSDVLVGENESDYELKTQEQESDWGDSIDEDELVPLWEVLEEDSDSENSTKAKGPAKNKKRPAAEAEEESISLSDSSSSNSMRSASDLEGDSESDEITESEESDGGSEDENLSDDSLEDDDSDEDVDNSALHAAIKRATAKSEERNSKYDKFAGPENSFLATGSGEKVSLGDLTGGAELRLLKSKVTPKKLSVPLAKRQQERLDREAAYNLAKKEISEWDDTVKATRRAEHLSFPLNPKQLQQSNPFIPDENASTGSLESKVNQLLVQGSLKDEKAASAFEDMASTTLSLEEMRKRRQELRHMRELMFREEQRAKRIKKIKSKTYRKIHKEERLHQEALIKAAQGDESEEESDGRKRALERASLRHKSTSKWAKRMIDQGMTKDASTRAELDEMLNHGEDLRKKVVGDQDSDSNDEVSDEETFEFKDLDQEDTPKKGIMGMKFMQEAEKRQRESNRKLIDGEDSEEENIGRRAYGPGRDETEEALSVAEKRAREEAELDDSRSLTRRLKKGKQSNRDEVELRAVESSDEEQKNTAADEQNPWLHLSSNKKSSRFDSVDKDSSQAVKAAAKLKRSRKEANKQADIDVNETLETSMVRGDKLSFEQQNLIRKAFAGDDVVAEFEAEKAALVEEEDDKEVDETLPGWGSWGGDGAKPKIRRIRKVQGIAPKKRKDHELEGVIFSERTNKKNLKYNASAVPFPYENAAQYERSLMMPMGNEWASRDTFQRQIRPRVTVKRGEIIDPVNKPKKH